MSGHFPPFPTSGGSSTGGSANVRGRGFAVHVGDDLLVGMPIITRGGVRMIGQDAIGYTPTIYNLPPGIIGRTFNFDCSKTDEVAVQLADEGHDEFVLTHVRFWNASKPPTTFSANIRTESVLRGGGDLLVPQTETFTDMVNPRRIHTYQMPEPREWRRTAFAFIKPVATQPDLFMNITFYGDILRDFEETYL